MNKQKIILLLLFIIFTVGAGNVYAQKISKNFEKEPLKSVLKEVEKQTGFSIIYKTDEIDNQKLINESFSQTPLETVLKQVLDEKLGFSIENKMIVIFKKDAQSAVSPRKSSAKEISGVVTDDKGEPIIGASVKVQGTTNGMTTNLDGAFNLKNVPENGNIEITYIGMMPQTVPVAGKSAFNIKMKDDARQLEEVVVTAMGIERKAKSLTYATQKMDNEDLMRVQDANFINSLQGKASGLSITPNAGGAGGASKILLRGNKSILGNNTPLIVVDGIPMSNPVKGQQGVTGGEGMGYNFVTEGSDALSSINPDDIENINILKGANAAALYGSAASNGVLMITTKKGKEGKMNIKITSNATFERPLVLPKLQNTYGAAINVLGKVDIGSWGKKMSDLTATDLAAGKITNTPQDYIGDFFRTGNTFNNSISVSGGTKNILSYFSYGNSNSAGMLERNNFNRHTVSFRQNYKLFKERVNLDVSVNYLNQNTKNRPGGGKSLNPLFHLYTAPRNVDMNYFRENYKTENGTWESPEYYIYKLTSSGFLYLPHKAMLKGPKQNWIFEAKDENNPYWMINMQDRGSQQERVYGYLAGAVNIIDGLQAKGRFSIDRSTSSSFDNRSATTQTPSGIIGWGEYWKDYSKSSEFYLDWLLSYNKEFGDYSVSATGGYVAHHISGEGHSISGIATKEDARLLIFPKTVNLFDIRSSLTGGRNPYQWVNWDEGLFLTAQLGYKNYLYLEGSYRQDWYRAFEQFRKTRGTPNNYGYFSFGANALVHEMVKLPEFWNHLKVRTSYSEVGNSIPNILYATSTTNHLTGATVPSQYANFENPIPEKNKSFEAGFDASFFKNSLTWDATFYYATMNNNYLILSMAGKNKPVNTGVIRNMGVETSLSYSVAPIKDLIWKTGVNISYNNNKILKTYEENGEELLLDQKIGFGGKVQVRYTKGGSYGDIYVTDFMRNTDGKIAVDKDGRTMLNNEKFTKYMGNMNAPYMLGWNNTFTYKGATLYFLIGGRIGGKVISFTEAYLDYYGSSTRSGEARAALESGNMDYHLNSEMTLGDLVNKQGTTAAKEQAVQNYYSSIGGENINASQYIYSGTNFRLREVSLGYTFKNLLGNSRNLTASVIGRNLFFLYKNAPVDPETSVSTQNSLGNIDIFNMPTSRSLGVSFSVDF